MELPEVHKAAILKEFNKPLSIEYVKTPKPAGEAVVVKVIGAGVCHTDVHIWSGERPQYKVPIVLGHEISGIVTAKGDKVPDTIKVGDKVLVYPWIPSEDDEYTIAGLTHLADKREWLGFFKDGGYQEYIYVPHYKYLVNINGLEDEAALAPLTCAGLTSYRAVKKVLPYVNPGDYVGIVGVGGLGTYAIQWLKASVPYVNIVGIDVRDEVFDYVNKITKIDYTLNASKTDPIKALRELTGGRELKAIIDFVNKKTLTIYSNALAKLGIYVLVGLMEPETSINTFNIVYGERMIAGSLVGSLRDLIELMNLVRKGLINYKAVISRRISLEQATEALQMIKEGKVVGRQVIVFK
jgi:D-arabinose 1-dehydrogenase-like Zn-dependent alcohol dehydrogenase